MSRARYGRVDVDYIARRTGYSTKTIHNWARAGKMPEVAPPKKKEWYKDVIDQWIKDNFEYEEQE